MPYRFNLTMTPSTGHYGSVDSAIRTMIDEHLSRVVLGISTALTLVLPVLSDEEYRALPDSVRVHFIFTNEQPRRGVEHRPDAQADPPAWVFNQAAASAQAVPQQPRQDIGALLGEARALNIAEGFLSVSRTNVEPITFVDAGFSRPRAAPPPVTRSRPGETFHDIEPEDI